MRRGKPLDEAKHRKWQQIIAAAACSGISVREFCRQRRIKEPQFYWWQRRLRSCGSAAARQLKEARPSRILKKRDIGAASFALATDPSPTPSSMIHHDDSQIFTLPTENKKGLNCYGLHRN